MLRMMLPQALLILLAGLAVWYGGGPRSRAARRRCAGKSQSRSHRDLSAAARGAGAAGGAAADPRDERPARAPRRGARGAAALHRRRRAPAAHAGRRASRRRPSSRCGRRSRTRCRRRCSSCTTATEQTTRLVNQLLSLARAEPGAGRAPGDRSALDLVAARARHHDRVGAARARPQHRSRLRQPARRRAHRGRSVPAEGDAEQPARQRDPLHAARRPGHGARHAGHRRGAC